MEKRFISAVKNVTKNSGKRAGTFPIDPPADCNPVASDGKFRMDSVHVEAA
jgi:hypothetical protein